MARSFKRPFQPSISSYFDRVTNDSILVTTSTSPSLTPNLPHSIQTSLLSVGMRVRKSVPEGYQTQQKVSKASINTTANPGGWGSADEASYAAAYRGLVPYCGILKTGGHSTQPVPAEEDLPPLQLDDEWTLPSGSQDSNTSSVLLDPPSSLPPSPSAARKRRREDADDEDLGMQAQSVSPRSRPVSHTRMPNLDQIRPMAIPRSRRRPTIDYYTSRESEMVDVGDFDDAPFLEDWANVS